MNLDLEEVFSIFKKNAGVMGKSNEIYPTGAHFGCVQFSGPHDSGPGRYEASIPGWDG